MRDDSPRRRGRPKATDPQEPISTRVPQSYYDRLNKLANKRGESMSQLVRTLIMLRIKPDTP